MKYSNKFFLAFAFLFPLTCLSQEVPKGFELTEIVKISEAYRSSSDMSFDMFITYADSARQNVVLEQLQGSYKIHNGNYWEMLDSIEYVQGSLYNLSIYHQDSTITVNNRQDYASVLQIPLMDSSFRQSNVSAIQVKRLNDSTRSLIVLFSRLASYHSYEIQYDLNSFLIRKVKYFLQDLASPDNTGNSGVDCITITFSNYSDQIINGDFFDESKFVYKQGDQLLPQPSYNGFHIVIAQNNTESH